MIKVTFYKESEKGLYSGFNVKGHSGYAEAGSDIVCASVSSMVMLFLNMAEGVYNADAELKIVEKDAEIDYRLKFENEDVSKAIFCLSECIRSVAEDYSRYVKVSEKTSKL